MLNWTMPVQLPSSVKIWHVASSLIRVFMSRMSSVSERDQIDLTVDPPPDLVIEIDISSASLDRFPIFANIGVPEVWRYDGTHLTIFALRAGSYQMLEASAVFPGVTSQIISEFIAESTTMPHTA
jgi:Uma2 family endonuclease